MRLWRDYLKKTNETEGACMRRVQAHAKQKFKNNHHHYRITNRGGKGVKTINITEKTGNLVAIKNVTDEDDIMIINKSGITIRMEVKNLRVMGRATQGVRLINIKENDAIASAAKVVHEEELETDENKNGTDIE